MDKTDNKDSGRIIRLTIMLAMTLWGGIGIVLWLRSGMPFGFGSAYAAGYSVGTILLFLMFGFGLRGLYKIRKAEKNGAGPQAPDSPPPQANDEPPGPLARILYAVMALLGAWGLVRWLLAGAPLQGDATFGAGYQYLTAGLMLVLIGCGGFGLWRARKVLLPPKKDGENKS